MESPGTSNRGVASDEDDDRFLIRSRVEVAFILKAVMQAGEIVTAYFHDGKDFAITALLAVDGNAGFVILDASKELAANRRLLSSDRISFVTSQDRVKIQFEVGSVTAIEFENRPALRIALPQSLLKFQRREYYRVETPVAKPLKCVVAQPDAPSLTLTVVDISLGGVCVTGYPEAVKFEPGTTFEQCRIDLPEVGMLTTTLQVRNTFEVPLRNGMVNRRAGCMFFKLPPASEAMVQRYIIRLERDRRAKLTDR
ncbi:MAG: flagellar brake protein [Burkholderiales bacterium]|jgi:c-di-GMP-binding flagellar brake protein YcgR|nr:flagellar brake protein [Burkholderiales bacterium]